MARFLLGGSSADDAVDRPSAALARLVALLFGLATLYYLAGGAVCVAAALLAPAALRAPQGALLAAATVTWTAALPWLSTQLGFDRPLAVAYQELAAPAVRLDPLGDIARSLTLGRPALALLVAALAVRTATARSSARRDGAAWLGPLLATACLLTPVAHDRGQQGRLQLAAHAARGEWSELLAVADRLSPGQLSYLESYAILLALAHTGQTGEALFRYPMQPYSLLRSADRRYGGDPGSVQKFRAASGPQLYDLDLDLGLVNAAEHGIHETLEAYGTRGRMLVSMARIQVLKGRPRAARVFLHLATAEPWVRPQAAALLAALERDPTLASDPRQEELRRHAVTRDELGVKTITAEFESLVREHPEHRLAREYLLAWYLLSHQLDRLVAMLPTLPAAGCDHLPRHYEEAVLVWEALHHQHAALGPWRVREETRARFRQFVAALRCDVDELPAVLATPGQPPDWALRLWESPWSDTYYYYRLFGISGVPR